LSEGDSLTYHLGQKFSTRDQDNDVWTGGSCAVDRSGAWWYNTCHYSNLNGRYYQRHTDNVRGVNWYYFSGGYDSLRFSEMKMRPSQL